MSTALDEIVAKLRNVPAPIKQELAREVVAATGKWVPNIGPQKEAYYSRADVLLFGGEPGGGKSSLLIGLAFTQHERSLIMRRQYGDLERLIEDALKVHGSREGFNGAPPPKLRINERQTINFVAAHRVGDEQGQMGKGHDLIGFDEATHFAESQVRFVMGWLRTETEGQRCRVVMATNPPVRPEGLWVIKMFAPWLDPRFPNPAKHGELRWVVSDSDGNDLWVDGPSDAREVSVGGRLKMVRPTSRTYIPSKVSDNPFYATTDYERQLDSMPEPYRSLLMGGFRTAFKDDDGQLISTGWIQEAQSRWQPKPPYGIPMCAIGVDGARSEDQSVLAIRHDGWYAPLLATPGKETPSGRELAGRVLTTRKDGAMVTIDCLETIGAQAYAHLSDNDIECYPFRGGDDSIAKDAHNQFGFWNRRAEAYWRFREALDPSQDGGSQIALPDDPELIADLTAPTFEMVRKGSDMVVKLLPKDKVKEKLGRSPDKGDAVVMAWYKGPRALTHSQAWMPDERVAPGMGQKKRPQYNRGPRRSTSR